MHHKLVALSALGLALFMPAALHAATRMRLVEAWAEAPVDPRTPVRITPTSAAQAQDPTYILIANQLGDLLADQGFNVVGREGEPAVDLLLDYIAYRRPPGSYYDSPINDPSYRALVVTAIDARAPHGPNDVPKVLWQTVIDSFGMSTDAQGIIPDLVRFGGRYYGRGLTPKGLGPARWCADRDKPIGSHIAVDCPAHPGSPPPPHASPQIPIG